MWRNTRRFVTRMLGVATLFGIIVGGSGPAQADAVKLTFFNWYGGETYAPFVEAFQKKLATALPEATIEMEYVVWDQMHALLQTRIAANQTPDLLDFKGQDIPRYAKAGSLLDLTGQPWLANIPEAARANIKFDGKEYGLPYTALYQGVFYNKKIFADNGLQVPATYADLLKICEVLKAKGITPFATHFADNWNIGNITMQFAMAEVFNKNPNWGNDLFDGKVTFAASEEYKRVFEHVKDVFDNTWSDTYSVDFQECDRRFVAGEAAMDITGTWSVTNFAMDPAFDYGIFAFPGQDAGAKLIMEPNHTWAVSATTAQPETALNVLKLVATDVELAKILLVCEKTNVLLKGVTPENPDPYFADAENYKNNDQIVDVSIGNVQIVWPLQEEYSKEITEWILGNKTLEAALAATDAVKDNFKQ